MTLAWRSALWTAALFSTLALGCDDTPATEDSGAGSDAGTGDAAVVDSGARDGAVRDAGRDAGAACETGCDWVELALGYQHSCVRRESGAVWCWGRNHRAELGDGVTRHLPGCPVEGDADEDCAARPVRVTTSTPVTAINTHGGISTCLLDDAGGVHCWGEDAYDIDGMRAGMRVVPTRFPGLADITQVSESWRHMCALDSSGIPFCVGGNDSGQVGDGLQMTVLRPVPVQRRTDADPTMSEPLTGVLEIRTATNFGSFSCARTADTLYCWGSNRNGQLGIPAGAADALACFDDGGNPVECVRTAAPVGGTLDASTITQLALGSAHACALTSAGTLWCWGDNRAGELGLGDTDPHTEPTEVPGLTDVVQVVAGASHTCVRRMGGQVLCAGINNLGQIGDGMMTHEVCVIGASSRDCVDTFTPVMGVTDARTLQTGRTHTCVVRTDNSVWCWGSNERLQLGDGPVTPPSASQRAPRFTPVQVVGLPD